MAPRGGGSRGGGYDADLWSDDVDITPYMRKQSASSRLEEEGEPKRERSGAVASQKKRRPQAEKRRLRSQESLSSVWTDPFRAFQEFKASHLSLPWVVAFLIFLAAFLLVVTYYLHLEYTKDQAPNIQIEHLRKDKKSYFHFSNFG